MPLTPGTKLGPYEIQSPLGAGGMGEVYRARDIRLDRSVAVKILASHLSDSPELKQRMEREARAISSLNHNNICHLYDIGSQDGTDFLVMELLQGETLAQRLAKGPLPLPDTLKVAIQIAEALHAAHRQGIVHRDLKPGNIMLTPSGAKLMDFGLAKPIVLQGAASAASVPAFTAAPTLSGPSPLSPLTSAGTMVGTFQYMSPEQIEGKEADARSDIFAFGAVLYEMASAKRPFEGKSQLSLASAILEKDPEPLRASHPSIPSSFERLVDTCLCKNPEERFQTAHDIKLQLQWISEEKAAPPPVSKPQMRSRFAWMTAAAAALALGLLAGYFVKQPPSQPTLKTSINPPLNSSFQLAGDQAGPPVISPDGSMLAFTAAGSDGRSTIWVRPFNATEAHSLPDTAGAIYPFWSPDSKSLGYFAEGKLRTVEAEGGSSQVVCDGQLGRGGAWMKDGTIIFSAGVQTPLMRVASTGGKPEQVTKLDSALHTSHRWPFPLPDGKHFLYSAINHDATKANEDGVYWASIDGRDNRLLFRSVANATYAAGYLLFARGDQLVAQPFDPDKGQLSGEAQPLAKGVMNDASTWRVGASAADNGLLIYATGTAGDLQAVWLDRSGKEIGVAADHIQGLRTAKLSPQGDRAALEIDVGMNDLWVLDLARGTRTRLTFGPVANTNPVWSPDGNWVAYFSRRDDKFRMLRKHSDGSGSEEVLYEFPEQATGMSITDWSRDGKYVLFTKGTNTARWQVWALPLQGDRTPFAPLPSPSSAGQLSPDGHWLAYVSNESGSPEVYIVPFGGGQGKWQVSADGGTMPRWGRDGKQLYFMDRTFTIYDVPVNAVAGSLKFGAPQPLARNNFATLAFYDVAPDGNRILLSRFTQQVNQSVTVVTNFTSGLRK